MAAGRWSGPAAPEDQGAVEGREAPPLHEEQADPVGQAALLHLGGAGHLGLEAEGGEEGEAQEAHGPPRLARP